eukprot:4586700-Amphidinium_carterae.1
MDDSCKSPIPMVIATMQRDAVATDLQAFHQRYPQAIRYGEVLERITTMTTWTDGKQWRKRRQTSYNTARH